MQASAVCGTCRFYEIRRYLMGRLRVATESPGCAKNCRDFPSGRHCPWYEREPGSD